MFCYGMLNSMKFLLRFLKRRKELIKNKSECIHWELFVHSPALSRDVILYTVASKHTAELLVLVEVSFCIFVLLKKEIFPACSKCVENKCQKTKPSS